MGNEISTRNHQCLGPSEPPNNDISFWESLRFCECQPQRYAPHNSIQPQHLCDQLESKSSNQIGQDDQAFKLARLPPYKQSPPSVPQQTDKQFPNSSQTVHPTPSAKAFVNGSVSQSSKSPLCNCCPSVNMSETEKTNTVKEQPSVLVIYHHKNAQTLKAQDAKFTPRSFATRESKNERQRTLIKLLREIGRKLSEDEPIPPSSSPVLPSTHGNSVQNVSCNNRKPSAQHIVDAAEYCDEESMEYGETMIFEPCEVPQVSTAPYILYNLCKTDCNCRPAPSSDFADISARFPGACCTLIVPIMLNLSPERQGQSSKIREGRDTKNNAPVLSLQSFKVSPRCCSCSCIAAVQGETFMEEAKTINKNFELIRDKNVSSMPRRKSSSLNSDREIMVEEGTTNELIGNHESSTRQKPQQCDKYFPPDSTVEEEQINRHSNIANDPEIVEKEKTDNFNQNLPDSRITRTKQSKKESDSAANYSIIAEPWTKENLRDNSSNQPWRKISDFGAADPKISKEEEKRNQESEKIRDFSGIPQSKGKIHSGSNDLNASDPNHTKMIKNVETNKYKMEKNRESGARQTSQESSNSFASDITVTVIDELVNMGSKFANEPEIVEKTDHFNHYILDSSITAQSDKIAPNTIQRPKNLNISEEEEKRNKKLHSVHDTNAIQESNSNIYSSGNEPEMVNKEKTETVKPWNILDSNIAKQIDKLVPNTTHNSENKSKNNLEIDNASVNSRGIAERQNMRKENISVNYQTGKQRASRARDAKIMNDNETRSQSKNSRDDRASPQSGKNSRFETNDKKIIKKVEAKTEKTVQKRDPSSQSRKNGLSGANETKIIEKVETKTDKTEQKPDPSLQLRNNGRFDAKDKNIIKKVEAKIEKTVQKRDPNSQSRKNDLSGAEDIKIMNNVSTKKISPELSIAKDSKIEEKQKSVQNKPKANLQIDNASLKAEQITEGRTMRNNNSSVDHQTVRNRAFRVRDAKVLNDSEKRNPSKNSRDISASPSSRKNDQSDANDKSVIKKVETKTEKTVQKHDPSSQSRKNGLSGANETKIIKKVETKTDKMGQKRDPSSQSRKNGLSGANETKIIKKVETTKHKTEQKREHSASPQSRTRERSVPNDTKIMKKVERKDKSDHNRVFSVSRVPKKFTLSSRGPNIVCGEHTNKKWKDNSKQNSPEIKERGCTGYQTTTRREGTPYLQYRRCYTDHSACASVPCQTSYRNVCQPSKVPKTARLADCDYEIVCKKEIRNKNLKNGCDVCDFTANCQSMNICGSGATCKRNKSKENRIANRK